MSDDFNQGVRTSESVFLQHKYLWGNGYRTYHVYSPGALDHNGQPIKNAGKRAKGAGWREDALQNPPRATLVKPDSNALNLGILLGEPGSVHAIDVDILDQGLVDKATALIEHRMSPTPLVRQGQPPKLALLYRIDRSITKVKTPELLLPDGGGKAVVEFLGRGQGLTSYGIHPDTSRPYQWLGDAEPLNLPLSKLDVKSVSDAQLQGLFLDLEELIRDAGAVELRPQQPRRGNGAHGGYLRNVNDRALVERDRWVPSIRLDAKRAPNGAWRIPARARGLPSSKQDISIAEDGIVDYALDKTMTAIDFVIAFGDQKSPLDAAKWLCEQIGVAPETLSFQADEPPPHGRPPDGPEPPKPPDPPPHEHMPPGPPPPQRVIMVYGGLRHAAADQGLLALKEADVDFFQRDGDLVWISECELTASDGSRFWHPGIKVVTPPALGRALGQAAKWMKYDAKGRLLRIDPPVPVVEQIATMPDQWPFRPIAGLQQTPTLRPDLSLLTTEGYDPVTALYCTFGDLRVPPIPERPTRAQAETALGLLIRLLDGFPFVDGPSQAVGVSGMITPVGRAAMDVVPAHAVTSPLPGTGKSLIIDCAAAISTGERAAVQAMAPKEEETEKRLVGAALLGRPIIVLDNVRGVVQGDFLCQVTERSVMQLRALGGSRLYIVKNNFTMFVDGNNLALADDMVRRSVRCALDANVENPELRQFTSNPLLEILKARGEYIAAALTILRWYIGAGMPNLLPRVASYERWSDLVRSAIVELGTADPVETMAQLRADDPGRQTRSEIFTLWAGLDQLNFGGGVTTRELISRAGPDTSLFEALLEIGEGTGPNAGKLDPKRLGNWLRKQVGAVAAGYKLEKGGTDKKRPHWQLVEVTGTGPSRGETDD